MKKILVFLFGLMVGVGLSAGFGVGYFYLQEKLGLVSPMALLENTIKKELPLLKYQIEELSKFELISSQIKILSILDEKPNFTSYLFSYDTQSGSMSGQLNLPKNISQPKVVVMIRGYVPPEIYETGVGTRAAAQVFADHGYITLAPDFLGFGQSSPDLIDTWEGRFVKPVQVMELINDLKQTDFDSIECEFLKQAEKTDRSCSAHLPPPTIGLWAHSNGGQIALTLLEGFEETFPTTLWAPVTAPFPYSVLFFTDEMPDEGKATRLWLSQFEKNYDSFAFSVSKHLDRLRGPLQLHHGTTDEAALFSWSLEFVDKVKAENKLRQKTIEDNQVASPSAQIEVWPEIDFQFYSYVGADHNLRPAWDLVVERDLKYFDQRL